MVLGRDCGVTSGGIANTRDDNLFVWKRILSSEAMDQSATFVTVAT